MKIFIEKGIPGKPFWDVCCDHGYIGIGALKSERFSKIYFVDQIPHVMQRLEALFEQSPHKKEKLLYEFLTMPAESIPMPIEGTFLIAGVGGSTIIAILNAVQLNADRVLLSPHLEITKLENYLKEEFIKKHSYKLTEVIQIPEGKRLRPLYILERL